VRQLLVKIQRDVQQGLPIATKGQTVAQFLARWMEDSVKPTVRERTYESYAATTKLHIVPSIGRIALDKLTPQDVQRMMSDAMRRGLSAASAGYTRRVLRIALNQAMRWNLIVRNVAALAEPPRAARHEIRPLTVDQARHFLDTMKGDRLEALYTVATALGMRKGEIFGLRWQDVDLDAQTLTVRYQLQRVGGKKQLVEPKTERSRRTVALPAFAVVAIRAHKIRQLEERLWAGSRWQDWGLVFTTPIGTPLESANVTHAFHVALLRAELPRQRFHDLRHCAASLMLAQGVEMRTIMEVLGHSQISTTSDLYSHVAQSVKRDAADRMEALFAVGK
jgi:integrase